MDGIGNTQTAPSAMNQSKERDANRGLEDGHGGDFLFSPESTVHTAKVLWVAK